MEIIETKLIRPSEYAKKHCVSRITVYNWINSGKIKSKKIGGYIFVIE